MMTRLQERSLRRTIKRGGSLPLPGHQGRTVQVEVTRHQTFTAVHIHIHGWKGEQPMPYYGPAREVYPLAAELLDSLVVPQAPEVAHG